MDENILLHAWARLYQAALLEFDPHELIKRIDIAANSIKDRLHELRYSDHPKERQSIQNAQNVLRSLRADGVGDHQKETTAEKASTTLPKSTKLFPHCFPLNPIRHKSRLKALTISTARFEWPIP